MVVHPQRPKQLLCAELATTEFPDAVAPLGGVQEWRSELEGIRDARSSVWKHVPDLFQPSGRAIISSAMLKAYDDSVCPFPMMRSAARFLARAGVPVASYRVMELDTKIQIPVVLRSSIFRPGDMSDRDPGDLVVGFVLGSHVFRAKEYGQCLDALVAERARLLRETIEAERRQERSEIATRQAEQFSHQVHVLTLLVGVLQGISPPETNHRIACAGYGTWARYGLGEVAVRFDDGADIELLLPPLSLYFCDPMYPGQARDNDPRGRGKAALRALQTYMRDHVAEDVSVSSEQYTIVHRYEGLEYQTMVVRFPKPLELKVVGALRWHFNIDAAFKELLQARPSRCR